MSGEEKKWLPQSPSLPGKQGTEPPEPCRGGGGGWSLSGSVSLPTTDKQALVYIKSKCMFVQADADLTFGM